jgi:hypothetical protein
VPAGPQDHQAERLDHGKTVEVKELKKDEIRAVFGATAREIIRGMNNGKSRMSKE